jgi:hypothetical protein
MYSPHVHFPSTPRLAFTGNTHSPGSYDRSCIAVSRNSCAMPERGGRVYSPTSMRPRPIGSYFHPRAFEACELDATAVPALLHDLSSETDDEECVSPKPTSPEPRVAVRMQGTPYPTPMPIRRTHSQEEFDHALSFLPHPPISVPKRKLEKQRNSSHRPRRSVTFQDVADCDGCLGGF